MGILDRLERRSYELLGHPRDGNLGWFGNARSISGASVTPGSAMTVMAIYRAVRLLANTIATLPIGIYERMEDGSRRPAPKHPLAEVLTRRPNRWQTPFNFKQMLAGHFELRGSAYAEIIPDGRGRVVELIPLHPDRVQVRSGNLADAYGEAFLEFAEDVTVWFEHTPLRGKRRILLWDEVLHWRGFSDDGLTGLSPLTIARETIGLALSNREYAARFLANSASPSGALQIKKTLSKEAKDRLRQSWNEQHGAVANVGKVAILEEDMTWQVIGFNPKDSQFIEQRHFDIEEIARMFDLPPHKLMDLERSTNNNIEHQGIEYVMDAILPRAVNLEETLERDLLLPSDLGRFYIEANLEGLQRGDSASRGTFYNTMFNIGALSPNDIRRKENMDPAEGGDEHFVPLNMVPLRQAAQLLADPGATDPKALPAGDPKAARALALRRRIARAHERLFIDAIGRTLKKEAQAGRRALQAAIAASSITPFTDWIEAFYPEHESWAARALEPIVQTAGAAIGQAVAAEVRLALTDDDAIAGLDELLRNATAVAARARVATSRSELRRLVKDTPAEQRGEALTALLADWEATRALREGALEAENVAKAVTEFVYRAAGVTAAA